MEYRGFGQGISSGCVHGTRPTGREVSEAVEVYLKVYEVGVPQTSCRNFVLLTVWIVRSGGNRLSPSCLVARPVNKRRMFESIDAERSSEKVAFLAGQLLIRRS